MMKKYREVGASNDSYLKCKYFNKWMHNHLCTC